MLVLIGKNRTQSEMRDIEIGRGRKRERGERERDRGEKEREEREIKVKADEDGCGCGPTVISTEITKICKGSTVYGRFSGRGNFSQI